MRGADAPATGCIATRSALHREEAPLSQLAPCRADLDVRYGIADRVSLQHTGGFLPPRIKGLARRYHPRTTRMRVARCRFADVHSDRQRRARAPGGGIRIVRFVAVSARRSSLSLCRPTRTRGGSNRTRPLFRTSTWRAASRCNRAGKALGRAGKSSHSCRPVRLTAARREEASGSCERYVLTRSGGPSTPRRPSGNDRSARRGATR